MMTSHSLTIIQEVLKINDETARSGRNIDSVVYIEDVLRPKLMEYPTYENIKGDMLGILPAFDDVRHKLRYILKTKKQNGFSKKC